MTLEENADITITKVEADGADLWAEKIRTSGRGYLHGKFNPAWTINNTPLGSMQNNLDTKDFGNYISIAHFGGIDIKLLTRIGYKIPSNKVASIISQLPGEAAQSTYYLFAAPLLDKDSDVIKAVGAQKNWVSFGYQFAADAASCQIIDGRTGKPDIRDFVFRFIFFLPPDLANQFITDAIKNTSIVENVFQKLHSGLLSSGLKRIESKELKFLIAEPQEDIDDYNTTYRLFRKAPTVLFNVK